MFWDCRSWQIYGYISRELQAQRPQKNPGAVAPPMQSQRRIPTTPGCRIAVAHGDRFPCTDQKVPKSQQKWSWLSQELSTTIPERFSLNMIKEKIMTIATTTAACCRRVTMDSHGPILLRALWTWNATCKLHPRHLKELRVPLKNTSSILKFFKTYRCHSLTPSTHHVLKPSPRLATATTSIDCWRSPTGTTLDPINFEAFTYPKVSLSS